MVPARLLKECRENMLTANLKEIKADIALGPACHFRFSVGRRESLNVTGEIL